MNDNGSNEFHDPELSRSLGRLSGAFPDEVTAFGQVRLRVKQARRRRAAAWSSGALVAVVAVGAFALGTQRGGRTLEPADRPDLVTDTIDDDATSLPTSVPVPTTTPVTVQSTVVETSLPETTDMEITGDSEPTNTEGDGPIVSATSGHSSGSPTTIRSGGAKPPKQPTPTIPATQPPATSGASSSSTEPNGDDDDHGGGSFTPQTQTFSGLGGSITVSMDSDGHLRMLSYTANAGYTADDIGNGRERVSIRFRNGDLSTRIRVEVSGATMAPAVVEEG
jgi:hypothetical protein